MIRMLSDHLTAWRRYRASLRELSRLLDLEHLTAGAGVDIVAAVRKGSRPGPR